MKLMQKMSEVSSKSPTPSVPAQSSLKQVENLVAEMDKILGEERRLSSDIENVIYAEIERLPDALALGRDSTLEWVSDFSSIIDAIPLSSRGNLLYERVISGLENSSFCKAEPLDYELGTVDSQARIIMQDMISGIREGNVSVHNIERRVQDVFKQKETEDWAFFCSTLG